jgi:hypothetical protein
MSEGGLSTRIDREHVVVVHLRPEPGQPAPDPVVIGAPLTADPGLDGRAEKVRIGAVGELIFTREVYRKLGRSSIKLVRVFAPHAWLYYEYQEREEL